MALPTFDRRLFCQPSSLFSMLSLSLANTLVFFLISMKGLLRYITMSPIFLNLIIPLFLFFFPQSISREQTQDFSKLILYLDHQLYLSKQLLIDLASRAFALLATLKSLAYIKREIVHPFLLS